MQERRNHYRTLGVQPDASIDVIRGAYRTLMQKMQRHPDLGGDGRDAASINEAWRVLRNPSRRIEYDRWLLEKYDIRDVAAAGSPAPPGPGGGNRRNYYRVLGVQPDAPPALIHSAYRVMWQAHPEDGTLIGEAYRVLSDPGGRERYDADLAADGHVDEQVYAPLIVSFCVFCKTPHNHYPGAAGDDLCAECASPLGRPAATPEVSGRFYRRLGLAEPARLFEYWPGPAVECRLEDMTPDGLRLTTARPLTPGQVVRITAQRFDVVACVVYRDDRDELSCFGLSVRAASFGRPGIFLDART